MGEGGGVTGTKSSKVGTVEVDPGFEGVVVGGGMDSTDLGAPSEVAAFGVVLHSLEEKKSFFCNI